MRRFVSFGILAAVVLVLLLGIKGLDFDPSPEAFLSEDDPELAAFSRVAKEFGDMGTVMVILDTSKVSLEKLQTIVGKVRELGWVNSATSVLDALKLGKINPFNLQIPREKYVSQSAGDLVLDRTILEDPLYSNLIVSSNGGYYGILITISLESELASSELVSQLREVIEASAVIDYRLTGESVANSTTFKSIMDLTFVYPPFIFLAIFLVYLIKFKKVSLSLLTLVPPTGAAILVVGIMGFFHTRINSLTVMVPSFIIIIGSAYGMHFLSRFQENSSLEKGSVERTVREERIPILFSALTTMAGFSSYILLNMKAFQDMGLYVCLGIFASAIFTIAVLPGLISPMEAKSSGIKPPGEIRPKLKKTILWTVLLVSAVSPLLILTIPLSIDQYAFFKENSQIRESAKLMKENFGWLTNYTLMVESKEGGEISLSPEQANQLTDLQTGLKNIEGFSKVMSLLDVSQTTNVPLPLLLRVLKSSDVFDDTTSLLVSEKALRFNLFSPESDSLSAEKLKEAVETLLVRYPTLTRDFSFTLAGTTLIWKSVNSSVVINQAQSLLVSFSLILLLLFVIFKNVRVALTATIPIALTALFNFIFMAVFRISLSISTALISGMLMGLVIDYAIHFTVWYRRLRDARAAYGQTAVAILTNGLSLMAGFSVLLLSPLLLYVDVAKLMVSGLAVGMLFTLVLLPEFSARKGRSRGENSDR